MAIPARGRSNGAVRRDLAAYLRNNAPMPRAVDDDNPDGRLGTCGSLRVCGCPRGTEHAEHPRRRSQLLATGKPPRNEPAPTSPTPSTNRHG